jgi:hypothetical protein
VKAVSIKVTYCSNNLLEALLGQFLPMTNGEEEVSGMNEVKLVFVGPLFFNIVNLEATVCGDPADGQSSDRVE